MSALRDVQGIGPFLESQLREAGYTTVAGLAAADPDNLLAVRGIGSVSARQIIGAAADLTSGTHSEPSGPKSTQDAEKELSGERRSKKNKNKNAKTGKKSNKPKAKAKKNKAKAKKNKNKNKNAKTGKKSNKNKNKNAKTGKKSNKNKAKKKT
jgi:hypothetical protein